MVQKAESMARTPALAEIEEFPEADRLDGFPHPRTTQNLYGQEAAERTLLEAFASGRMHHGWLVAGPEGIGKATLAYRFVKFLLAHETERDPFGTSLSIDSELPVARQVSAQSHPGLLVLRRPYDLKSKRFKTELTIDEARRLRHFLAMTPEAGAWRAVIVDSADDLNIPAANALLKSLEEPPPKTMFLLVASQPGRLLSTIRSRCRTLEMAPLSSEALKKAAAQAIAASSDEQTRPLPAGKDWDVLQHLAAGSVRRLLALNSEGGLELYRRIHGHIASLPKVDWPALHALGDEISSQAASNRFELTYDLLLALVARLVRGRATGEAVPDEAQLADRLIGDGRLASWAEAWQAIVAAKSEADALNLDRKSLLLGTFSRLEATARS